MQSNSEFHIQHERTLDFLDGTTESPREHCPKSPGTLTSLQPPKSLPCTINQLEMRPDSTALAPELFCLSHYTWLVASRPVGNSRHSPRTPSQVYRNTKFRTASEQKLRDPNPLEMKADFLASTQEECQLSTSTSRGGFFHLQVCQTDPVGTASSGMDTDMPSLDMSLEFPAVTRMKARLSSHQMRGYLSPLWRPYREP